MIQEAQELLEKALELAPDMPEALMWLGTTKCVYSDFFDEAMSMLTKAIKLKPDYAAAFNIRGLVYTEEYSRYKNEDYHDNCKKAIADLTEAIRIRPFDACYYYNRGQYYSELGEHKKALDDFTSTIKYGSKKFKRETSVFSLHEEAFQSMPENLKTMELCLDAIKLNGNLLKYAPETLKEQIDKSEEVVYDPNLKPGKCSICGLPLSFVSSLVKIGNHGYICDRCRGNNEILENIKRENEMLYYEIIKINNEEIPVQRNEFETESGWHEIDGHKIYFGSPKWLTDLTIDELRIRAKEYERPRPPEPIIINNIAIHKNQTKELLEGEIFKKNDEKNVEVSNFGRIKYGDSILKQYDPKNNGYLFVDIKSMRKDIPEKVYRLVAETWIEKPDPNEFRDMEGFNYNTVHHISNNGYDNRVENLIWVTEWQHAMIHPWMSINQFSSGELNCLLDSYAEITITSNDYQRIIDIAKRIQKLEEDFKKDNPDFSGGYENYFIDIIEAMEKLKIMNK